MGNSYKFDIEELSPYRGETTSNLRGHVPWQGTTETKKGGDRHHHGLSEWEKKTIPVCLTCDRTRCTGNCIKIQKKKEN
jgi:hypothetical protein